MSNTDLILKMYEYFNSGQIDRIGTELFDPQITWRMPGHHPLSGEMRGVPEVMSFFGQLSKAHVSVDGVHFGELDDGTVVEKHMGHAKVGEQEYVFPTATTYEIRDGRIGNVQVHTADQHAVDHYMWSVFELKPVGGRLAD